MKMNWLSWSEAAKNRTFLVAILAVGTAAAALICTAPAAAQGRYEAKVIVDAERARNIMAFRAISADASVWDDKLMNPQAFRLMRDLGVTTLRYPGPGADRYHWSTNKSTRTAGVEPAKYDAYLPSNGFGQFISWMEQIGGTAIVTVNYGSNQEGTGGGEPAEAAAWVAYANGDPSDTKTIGKDSTGVDWKTVGYWATLRASAQLEQDDGYNFLRAAHPQPFKVKYWEIGREVYNNGFYMKDGQNNSEEDLHVPHLQNSKEEEKLRSGSAKLSPEAYGAGVAAFSKAMKAVDPTIKIGAVLLPPPVKGAFTKAGAQFEVWNGGDNAGNTQRVRGNSGWVSGVSEAGVNMNELARSDWNPGVMKGCGEAIDFVVIQWRFGKNLPPDWKKPDVPGMLAAPYTDLPQIVNGLVDLFKKYGGANAGSLQFTIAGVQAWGIENEPLVQTLLMADTYVSLIEDGSAASIGSGVHDPGFLDGANAPGPLAWAAGMVHILARPNDPLVQSESNSEALTVHSAKRPDGGVVVMLINKDSTKSASVRVSIKGAKLAAKGARFDYGKNTNGQPVKNAIDTGANFTVEVPPYTVTDVVIPKGE